MDHELIHLLEQLIDGKISCSTNKFKTFARQIFFHTDTKHNLITQQELAFIKFGIQVGDYVSFDYKGKKYKGIVDRITKRSTVIVKTNSGTVNPYKENYMKFYIPISMLIKKE